MITMTPETQALIERLAGEAGASLDPTFESVGSNPMWLMTSGELAKFAELVARECARIECEPGIYTRNDMAAAIRQRFGVGE